MFYAGYEKLSEERESTVTQVLKERSVNDMSTVLVPGWTTTENMARMVGLTPFSFRVWLNRHKEEVREVRLGHTSIISIADTYRARES